MPKLIRQSGKLLTCSAVFAAYFLVTLIIRAAEKFKIVKVDVACRLRATQCAAKILARVLCLKIHLPPDAKILAQQFTPGCLVVSNHQSYLDILVLAAHFPVLFVAKQEVRKWPILGFIARQAGTLFIERNNIRQSKKCAPAIAAALQQKNSVLIFPEGTSTNGQTVLPFKPMLFSAACQVAAPVLPLTLQYQAINHETLNEQTCTQCCWFGEMEFVSHFWRVLALYQIDVRLEVHPMLYATQHTTPQELALSSYEKVAQAHTAATQSAATITTIDDPSEFLLTAVLLSLVNNENQYLSEGKYGET